MTASDIINFAAITIFARECLEGAIIIGEYRTIILRTKSDITDATSSVLTDYQQRALREIWIAAGVSSIVAILIICCIAVPLAVASTSFETHTAYIIEGTSKIVAAISLLILSLEIPKFFGVYGRVPKFYKPYVQAIRSQCCSRRTSDIEMANTDSSCVETAAKEGDHVSIENVEDGEMTTTSKEEGVVATISNSNNKTTTATSSNQSNTTSDDDNNVGPISVRAIRFNVAWNIWREVAECGIFLIPLFLSKENLTAIPLSAAVGCIVGLASGYGIYRANQTIKNKKYLVIFTVALLVILSAGLFTGGCHKIEGEVAGGETQTVWELNGNFWDVNRLPMTLIKPFGYNDSRTLLEILCYWMWLLFSALLHYRLYIISPKISPNPSSSSSEAPVTSNDNNTTTPRDESSVSVVVGPGLTLPAHSASDDDDDNKSPKTSETSKIDAISSDDDNDNDVECGTK